jgi:hypothetical protein
LKSGLGKLLSNGKVRAWEIDLLKTSHNLCSEQLRLDLPHHFYQSIILIFDVGDFKSGMLQDLNVNGPQATLCTRCLPSRTVR